MLSRKNRGLLDKCNTDALLFQLHEGILLSLLVAGGKVSDRSKQNMMHVLYHDDRRYTTFNTDVWKNYYK